MLLVANLGGLRKDLFINTFLFFLQKINSRQSPENVLFTGRISTYFCIEKRVPPQRFFDEPPNTTNPHYAHP